eukprot:jgi/Tetstr1/447956/TSEL_035261.t1
MEPNNSSNIDDRMPALTQDSDSDEDDAITDGDDDIMPDLRSDSANDEDNVYTSSNYGTSYTDSMLDLAPDSDSDVDYDEADYVDRDAAWSEYARTSSTAQRSSAITANQGSLAYTVKNVSGAARFPEL